MTPTAAKETRKIIVHVDDFEESKGAQDQSPSPDVLFVPSESRISFVLSVRKFFETPDRLLG